MKQRFYIFLFAIILTITIVVAAAVSNSSTANRKTTLTRIISITVLNNIGINQIDVTNENTGETFTFTKMSLPNQFNCSLNDYLIFRVTVEQGYTWNAWWFSPMDIWCRGENNVMQIFASPANQFGNIINNNEIVMIPNCIRQSTTPSPNPTAGVIE